MKMPAWVMMDMSQFWFMSSGPNPPRQKRILRTLYFPGPRTHCLLAVPGRLMPERN